MRQVIYLSGALLCALLIYAPYSFAQDAASKPTPVDAPVIAKPNSLFTTVMNQTSFVNTSVPLTTVIVPAVGVGDVITVGFELLQ